MDEAYERIAEVQFPDDTSPIVDILRVLNEGPFGITSIWDVLSAATPPVTNAEAVDLIDAGEYPAMPCGAD